MCAVYVTVEWVLQDCLFSFSSENVTCVMLSVIVLIEFNCFRWLSSTVRDFVWRCFLCFFLSFFSFLFFQWACNIICISCAVHRPTIGPTQLTGCYTRRMIWRKQATGCYMRPTIWPRQVAGCYVRPTMWLRWLDVVIWDQRSNLAGHYTTLRDQRCDLGYWLDAMKDQL